MATAFSSGPNTLAFGGKRKTRKYKRKRKLCL
jgi:hypothetical protein